MSDSRASIDAIEACRETNDTTRIALNSIARDKNIILVWVPGHRGIDGNELADECARRALDLPATDRYTPDDAIKLVKNYMKDQVRIKWEGTRDNKLRSIKRDIERGPLNKELLRHQEVKITRLRLGHTLSTHKHIFEKNTTPNCDECGIELSIFHLFETCQKFKNEREKLNLTLSSLMNREKHFDVLEYLKIVGIYNDM